MLLNKASNLLVQNFNSDCESAFDIWEPSKSGYHLKTG